MIFSPKDKWEEAYIKNLRNADFLAWGDEEAFYRYPKHNFIYDKYLLSKTTKTLKVWDLEKEIPNKYPVYVKPKTNFFGLGKDSYVAFSKDEIEDVTGLIAQEFAEGTHYSTDFVLDRGKVIDCWTFVGHKNFYNDFTLWESVPFPDSIRQYVENLLHDYTGICNFESINGKIIEGHLRGSLQFFDICGGLLEQMPKFIDKGTYTPVKFKNSYSKVLRTRHDGYVTIKKLPRKPKSVASLQLAHESKLKLSTCDPSSFRKRFAVINGFNLKDIENYAISLRGNIFISRTKNG